MTFPERSDGMRSLTRFSEVIGLRAAIYARVSTEDQAREGFSIAAQLKRLHAYCKARDWKVVGEFVDEGYSGRNTRRPQYEKMMSEHDNWDVLVVLKMDRIHRNSQNFTHMMNDLKEWNRQFNSMQESFDTPTAIGRFVMDIIQRIAQLESEQIGERVLVGMKQKAQKKKGMLGFGEPYGYTFKDKTLVINEEEATIVREIYRRYLRLESLEEISEQLNGRGIPTKKGRSWKKETVRGVLKDPLYVGKLTWTDHIWDDHHPPIIDLETFYYANKLIDLKRRNHSTSHVGDASD